MQENEKKLSELTDEDLGNVAGGAFNAHSIDVVCSHCNKINKIAYRVATTTPTVRCKICGYPIELIPLTDDE